VVQLLQGLIIRLALADVVTHCRSRPQQQALPVAGRKWDDAL
jgi:hypothetical protein